MKRPQGSAIAERSGFDPLCMSADALFRTLHGLALEEEGLGGKGGESVTPSFERRRPFFDPISAGRIGRAAA